MSYTRVVSGVLLGAGGRLIGLDIEQLDRKTRAVQRYCSEGELAWLNAYSNRQQGAMILWSFKEALVKALGTGLRLPKAAIEIAVSPQTNGAFVATFPMFPCLCGHAVMDNDLGCVMAIVSDLVI
jgi:phosphopantetheinyl transferase